MLFFFFNSYNLPVISSTIVFHSGDRSHALSPFYNYIWDSGKNLPSHYTLWPRLTWSPSSQWSRRKGFIAELFRPPILIATAYKDISLSVCQSPRLSHSGKTTDRNSSREERFVLTHVSENHQSIAVGREGLGRGSVQGSRSNREAESRVFLGLNPP